MFLGGGMKNQSGLIYRTWRGQVAGALALLTLSSCALSSENHGVLGPAMFTANEATAGASKSPRMIIGIEKFPVEAGQARIATADDPTLCGRNPSRCVDLRIGSFPPLVEELWGDRLDDRTQQIVSHVVDLDANGACVKVHSSVYGPPQCEPSDQPPTINVDHSWDLLEPAGPVQTLLEQRIKDGKITHVIVMTTGWNVQQKDTIKITATWIDRLNNSFKDPSFRPLYILLTWPAHREGDWKLDFFNKGHDADEVGLTWANVLVNRTLATLPSRDKINVVLIGHSFGARLLSTATFSGQTIGAKHCGGADLLIGLQAAFSNARFLGSSGDTDGDAYKMLPDCKTKLAYTTSRRDEGLPWAPSQFFGSSKYMGGPSTYARANLPSESRVLEIEDSAGTDHALVINADNVICNHNDVAKDWTFWRIAKLINNHANKGGPWTLAAEPSIPAC